MNMPKKLSVLSKQLRNGDITLTNEMKKDLANLKHRKINLSDEDAPKINDWQGTVRTKFYRPA